MKGRKISRRHAPARNPRAQIIPNDQFLRAAAASIRDELREASRELLPRLARIGKELFECRERLKEDRIWYAWLKHEFRWSRRYAENFIRVHLRRHALKAGDSLPLSMNALFALAEAPAAAVPKIVRVVEKSGQPATVRRIMRLVSDAKSDTTEALKPLDLISLATKHRAQDLMRDIRQLEQDLNSNGLEPRAMADAIRKFLPPEKSQQAADATYLVLTYLQQLFPMLTGAATAQKRKANLKLIEGDADG